MLEIEREIEIENEEQIMRLVYMIKVGTNSEGLNIYQMLLSDNIEEVWGEQWSETPAGICRSLTPEEGMYIYKKEIKTDINFKLAQDNCCCSMQDMKDNCIALAYEDIYGYEEYPEPFRLVFHYGENIEEVDAKLRQRDIRSYFV